MSVTDAGAMIELKLDCKDCNYPQIIIQKKRHKDMRPQWAKEMEERD